MVLSIYFSQDLIQKLSNIFIQDLASGRGFAHHKPGGWCPRQGRTADGTERDRLGWRLWHQRGGNLGRGGKSWTKAALGEDLGKYAFRAWSHESIPKQRGKLSFAARATNSIGQTQTNEPVPNPAGYHHNAVQTVTLDVV